MKWISKYSFFELYKHNVGEGFFPPVTGLKLKIFEFLNEHTIFLAGSKNLQDFHNKQGNSAVLFVSKDRGNTFKEILFPDEIIIDLDISEKYSLVKTSKGGYSVNGRNGIYLLNNKTLDYIELDRYSSSADIYYEGFNGEFAIYSKGTVDKFINLLTKEEYPIPDFLKGKNYIIEKKASVVYLDKKEIKKYNFITGSNEMIKKLNKSYDFISYRKDYFELGKLNMLKTEARMYDVNENEIYKSNEKTEERVYRYRNFACKYIETRPYIVFYYSYNYGNTWYEYKTEEAFTTSFPKGYYKDKYVVLDICFYDKKDSTDIIIGQFEKPRVDKIEAKEI
ncbi:hypothetical protein [Tenacibaculum maritimum]|uniref:hypothetical protein n=1 Tax=Tenacibaculum maritimum TaxID=107401 RepID=UPI00132FBF5E|nr:hypothetical protein [Tenacibaculum maritimum]MDB0601933.1 hypothetical protein [Tenacibaculum maritimum]MDB0613268.1 hypothetical protein [Tenacibaculum maritimum]